MISGGKGQDALGRSAILVEFAGEDKQMIGDETTTSDVGDEFEYTLTYKLSDTAVQKYQKAGVDLKSGNVGYWYADHYEDDWKPMKNVDVSISTPDDGKGAVVKISGITKDLPGAIGPSTPNSSSSSGGGSSCLIERSGAPSSVIHTLRQWRDVMMGSSPGRWIASFYYSWLGSPENGK